MKSMIFLQTHKDKGNRFITHNWEAAWDLSTTYFVIKPREVRVSSENYPAFFWGFLY